MTPAPVAPTRSLEQRMSALTVANEIRTYRARRKRDLAAGRIEIGEFFSDPLCATMRVWDAVITLPKWGRVKVNALFTRHMVSPSKTFGGLSVRQREALLGELRTDRSRPRRAA